MVLLLAITPADANQVRKVICQYALTSANDFPQRDPENWRLLGSNDGGKTWTTLDVRHDEIFTGRQQRKLYHINNKTAFEMYRLEIDRVREPSEVDCVQLAEIELIGPMGNDLDPTPVFSDDISAQGDNAPAETVANLFDGRVDTKWLDWASNNIDRASWVQWQYKDRGNVEATNISQLLSLRSRADDGRTIRFAAVVVGHLSKDTKLCLLDNSGYIELDNIQGAKALPPGQMVLVTGTNYWADRQPELKNGHARPLHGMATNFPERITLEQPLNPEENFKWVEVEGKIQYRHSAYNQVIFDIQAGTANMRVFLQSPGPSPAPPREASVLVRGICEGAYDEEGQWVAANLWAVGWKSVTVLDSQKAAPPTSSQPFPAQPANAGSLLITNIAQIRHLTPQQIRNHPRVRVRGIITGLLGGFIQDDTGGIEVDFNLPERRKLTELGAYIEVDGTVEQSDFGDSLISADHVTVLGRGKLPEPQRLSISQLMKGRIDGQWVEVEGVVHSTDGSHLSIVGDDGELMATLGVGVNDEVLGLVDAEIRARGVAIVAMDDKGRIQGINLLIPSMEQVDVIQPPPDVDKLPVQTIRNLLGLSGQQESFHRVKVEGVVTLRQGSRLFIQDGTGSAMVIAKQQVVLNARLGRARWLYWRNPQTDNYTNTELNVQPGDRVQIIGFPGSRRYSPVLTEALVDKLDEHQALKPEPVTADGIEEGGLDSTLVYFEGILRGENSIGEDTLLALEWHDRTLQVFVPGRVRSIAMGSRLRVTGICQLDPAPYEDLGMSVGLVRIQTRSPSDVLVLESPSWWTVQHSLELMGGMILVILLALLWIKSLHQQVAERSEQLAAEIRLREQTERHHALEQERARIAKDLHDDLGANLTQIVFLSERVEVARHDGQETARWFNLIPATARRTIQSLDEIVWAINPRHDSLESLANYLSQFAQEHLGLARIRCVLDVPTVLPTVPLSAEVRHNLLLTVREALQNVVTHAKATEVRLSLKLDANTLTISIADNGTGFNPASVSPESNGLQNMQRRMQEIEGQLEVISQSGKGTTVVMKLLHSRVIGVNGNSHS